MSWQDWPPSAPLRVEGGLTARSTRGAIGTSWWSRRFVAVLESFGAGGRLTRGRAYARKGQVLSLDLAPGVVTARVQGSRATPYQVSIRLPVLSEQVWQRVAQAVGDQALFAAELLAGQLPAELEEVVTQAGGALFPTSFDQLSLHCTCPDWSVPCKHLAAAFYLLAETFDDDPFRILRWRGGSREQLLAAISGPTPSPEEPPQSWGSDSELADLPATTAAGMLDRFWVAPVPLPARPPVLAAPADLVLRQLPGPPASLGGAVLAQALEQAYRRLPADPQF